MSASRSASSPSRTSRRRRFIPRVGELEDRCNPSPLVLHVTSSGPDPNAFIPGSIESIVQYAPEGSIVDLGTAPGGVVTIDSQINVPYNVTITNLEKTPVTVTWTGPENPGWTDGVFLLQSGDTVSNFTIVDASGGRGFGIIPDGFSYGITVNNMTLIGCYEGLSTDGSQVTCNGNTYKGCYYGEVVGDSILTETNATFVGNTFAGLAIYQGRATENNAVFTGNNGFPVALQTNSTLTMNGGVISNNIANPVNVPSGDIAGVVTVFQQSTLVLNAVTVTGNSGGYAVAVSDPTSSATLNACVLSGNPGGALANNGGTLQMAGDLIANNSVSNDGSAIYLNGGQNTVNATQINGNTGGAAVYYFAAVASTDNLSVSNTVLSGNTVAIVANLPPVTGTTGQTELWLYNDAIEGGGYGVDVIAPPSPSSPGNFQAAIIACDVINNKNVGINANTSVLVASSVVAGNGIDLLGGEYTLTHSLIQQNPINARVASTTLCIIGQSPDLLSDNEPASGSPLIGAGLPTGPLTIRGKPRGSRPNIGAY